MTKTKSETNPRQTKKKRRTVQRRSASKPVVSILNIEVVGRTHRMQLSIWPGDDVSKTMSAFAQLVIWANQCGGSVVDFGKLVEDTATLAAIFEFPSRVAADVYAKAVEDEGGEHAA